MRLRRRRPDGTLDERELRDFAQPSPASLAGLVVEQGLAEAGVRAGPDTACVLHRWQHANSSTVTVEHRFMSADGVCICGQVQLEAAGFRGRPIVLVEERRP